ncbi:hypothetical protein EVAR_86120_1 [Eumeta japonica]|uniref:Uncharacterized protein n=1 Tax=Eumeta variegata TaxID=151549 RepID=A0A4C1V0K4_EUMVA|nr:hypothetical protein EVAR_86120_1 [Eumeta japonica]
MSHWREVVIAVHGNSQPQRNISAMPTSWAGIGYIMEKGDEGEWGREWEYSNKMSASQVGLKCYSTSLGRQSNHWAVGTVKTKAENRRGVTTRNRSLLYDTRYILQRNLGVIK